MIQKIEEQDGYMFLHFGELNLQCLIILDFTKKF